MRVAVIIPAYNEERTIDLVIRDFYLELSEANYVIVDNNSSDKTALLARETLNSLDAKGNVLFEPKQGKANAIRKAFTEIDADVYVMVDADATYLGTDVHELLKPVLGGKADMVVGDRLSSDQYKSVNKRNFHTFGNNLIKKIINFVFHAKLHDIMTGYRAFSRKFVKNYPILVEGFELETEMTLHALDKRFKIVEIPIKYQDRKEDSFSKLNTFKDGIKVLMTIFTIFKNYRPFAFFTIWAFLFFLCSFFAALPALIEYIETQYIRHVPFTILSAGLMVISIVVFAIGLILATVVRNHRFNYELRLINFDK